MKSLSDALLEYRFDITDNDDSILSVVPALIKP